LSRFFSRATLAGLLALSVLASLGLPAVAEQKTGDLLSKVRLAASFSVIGEPEPGDAVQVEGSIERVTQLKPSVISEGVAATFSLILRTEGGETRGPFGPFETLEDGFFAAEIPGEATADLGGDPSTGGAVVAVEAVDVSSGDDTVKRAGATALRLSGKAKGLKLKNDFTSSVGWVKPGQSYPFRLIVRNYSKRVKRGARVTVPPVDGTTFMKAKPAKGSGRASISGGSILWKVGKMPARRGSVPAIKTVLVIARADSTTQDPRIVWKNLSTTATLRYRGEQKPKLSTSHGPKVIPPDEIYNSARYGDRPFPVVPVDYFDRKHNPDHKGSTLRKVINSKKIEGSTFNLFQEMSYGQLFPQAGVPSASIATADFEVKWKSERYKESGFQFTELQPQGSCHGTTQKDVAGTPAYAERIQGGWYQLPGTTDYYGDDKYGTAVVGSVAGVGSVQSIDDACGPTGKAVYDAAHIADPEIDYSDYDTDKDGVVDFFMMVFVGLGGNGESQIDGTPSYDNIWPHSSSLEDAYTDPATGLKGYVTDDQLKDLRGRKMFYTSKARAQMTTKKTKWPVYVRVGPYNVNPENAIDKASVISHEYGHSLGLPDYYSTGARTTYGDFNLMATDKSQHMDVNAKQELGWIVPRVLKTGTRTIKGWRDSKRNTHRIDWETKSGAPYRLKGKKVDNGEAYVAKLPRRKVIDAKKVKEGASPSHVWWSKSGNDFGCPPSGGHNLDIFIPELENIDPGETLKLRFKSHFEIEWDYDYGFVLTSVDQGQTYQSRASENGYTTPLAQNPNANGCQAQYGNGITGTNKSYQDGTAAADRVLGEYPEGGFVQDSYDISDLAGQEDAVIRFTYSTDPGLAKIGWFIDNLEVVVGPEGEEETIYRNKFENKNSDNNVFNGGCKEDLTTAQQCTEGWGYITTSAGSPADHAYYMEMRDRSGFDMDGRGMNSRDAIAFNPGLLLVYTDETHGYGNAGTDSPPAQSPLDSQPQPGNEEPNLNDATWTAADGDSSFSDFGDGHTDNYEDPNGVDDSKEPQVDELWHFRYGCLQFKVLSMKGTDVGPLNLPGNLVGKVRVKVGKGCGKFDYGY
jgi:immune inhibitor A